MIDTKKEQERDELHRAIWAIADEQDAGNTEFEYAQMSDADAEAARFSHLAGYEEIAENDYNLSVSTYVEAEDTREKIDIVKLNAEIEQIVARQQVLCDEIAKIIAEIEVG